MDRGAWQATGHGVAKESDLATKQQQEKNKKGSWPQQSSAVIKFPQS